MSGPWITELEKIVADMMENGWNNYDYVEKFEPSFLNGMTKHGLMTSCCTTQSISFCWHLILKKVMRSLF